MSEPDFSVPGEHLPPGFAEGLERPPVRVAAPRPAATVVLLRQGAGGLEVLLLQRIRSAGFVPGAWVFPGGRVDGEDAGPDLVARLDGVAQEDAAERLALPPDADPPALAYYVAAIREAFEEAGVLVGRDAAGRPPPAAAADAAVGALRHELMEDPNAFASVLDRLGCRLDGGALEYIAHWITPEAEPRRFDTRFFAAAVPADAEPLPDPREASRALWLTPERAVEENLAGRLPMVFPTVHTLRALRAFRTPADALASFGRTPIRTILPRLVKTPTGVGIQVETDSGG